MTATLETAVRTYEVRTYGCQMLSHIRERLSVISDLQIQFSLGN